MRPPQNVRRAIGVGLAAPLDAKEDAARSASPMDPVMAAILVALIGFGVVMVYSASAVAGTVQHHDPQYFLKRQAAYAIGATLLLFGTSRVDYHRLYKLTYPVLAGVGLLMLACVVGFGHSAGGAARWLSVGPVHIQPAEMAKLAVVAWLAYSLAKKADRVKTFAVGFLPHLIVAGVFMLLCMKQTDFGSAVVLLLLTFTLLFVAGAKLGYILGASILGSMFAVVAVRFSEYRWRRYVAWLDMESHKQDLAYQTFQSVLSFGSGGTWGMGIGRGLQTLYLPEAHTDFVAAIIGEELGFVGILALCAAYLMLVTRGVRAALRAPDDYGSYLAFGIATMFGVQALVNLAVELAIVPTKGLTLPFVSFGGSSLLVNAVAAGILLNVSRQGDAKNRPLGKSNGDEETPDAAPIALDGEELPRVSARPSILVAGGGTGGHVYPGLAVADALRSIADVDLVFVGTPRGLEARVIPQHGYALELLDVRPMKGGGPTRAIKGAMIAARETVRAIALVRRVRPRVVLSVGGYAAGPVSLAAALLGVKLAVLEPNSVVGFANRMLAPFAARAYVAYRETAGAFRKGRARVVGVPLRAGFAPDAYAPREGSARVLVMGGSQGAQAINERMPMAIARAQGEVRSIEVVHQAGRDRDGEVREAYARANVERATVTPFIDDVPGEIARADVIVARAGAVTVAEIAAVGRASILIPFPHAADDHQARNAESLARDGGAVAIRQESADVIRIAGEIVRLLTDRAARARIAAAARAHGRPQAAMDLARDLLDLAGIAPSLPRPRALNGNGAKAPARSEVR